MDINIDSAILNLTQRRAAREALAEGGRPPFVKQQYVSVVRQLQNVLQRHGLGQALVYLEMRGDGRPNSAFTLLSRQLGRWLVTNMGVTEPDDGLAALAGQPGQPVLSRGERAGLAVRALPARSRGGRAMNWPWRMPRDLPWLTPYPLPRDTSEALLAEGQCDNFSLLIDRYLAFGDNRGRLELLRELTNRRALVPDYSSQRELIAAHDARWRQMADDVGAITFSAHPEWRVIVGLGTNDILEGGITLHPVFGFPVVPATALKGVSRAYARWVLESPDLEIDTLLGRGRRRSEAARRPGVPGRQPRRSAGGRARRGQPDLRRLLSRHEHAAGQLPVPLTALLPGTRVAQSLSVRRGQLER